MKAGACMLSPLGDELGVYESYDRYGIFFFIYAELYGGQFG